MKHTNTVYRYAIRKLKVGTASIAVAALMFLGSGNNLVNAADLNQESAFVANAGSSEIEQIEEKLPSQELPNSDLDVDTKALEADKSPVTNTEPVEINTPVPVEEAESIASELANLDLPEDVESQDSATQEATIKALAKDVSDAKENPAEEATSSDQKASLAEAESTVAKQAAVVNGANEAEEVKPLANANNTSDNKLVLPPGFTADLFKEGAYTASQIDAIAKPGRALNTYKSNEADKNRIVDVNNLTEEQRKELSLYIANLINPIRQQFGKQPFKVNAGSLNAAQKVANAYQEDNWYAWTNSHDVNATTRALANVANGWGENLATISPNTTTMDSLKQQFHYQTVWMLFDDSHANFGHARNFLLFENPYGNKDVYLGVATNRAGANDSSKFGTQYYTMFAPKDGATEFTPGNDYSNDSQPTQPTEPTQPTQPTEPTQPTQPTQPTEPTQPTQPTEPTQPTQPTQPTEPTQPTQPTEPTQPTQPTEPTQPTQPTEPTQPTQPTEPTQPTQPTEPTQPTQPTQPTTPTVPTQPEQPNKPGDNNGTGQNDKQDPSQNDGTSQMQGQNDPADKATSTTPNMVAPKAGQAQADGKQLPDTGESSNLIIIGAAIISALAGLALMALRRRKI